MKKIYKCFTRFPAIILIPAVLIICVTVSCQPTPSIQPVIGRQEDILKSVIATAFEKIHTPEHISKSYDYEKLNIAFDADITVPETTAYPVTEVTKKAFSDDDILSCIKLLSGRNDEIYSDSQLL
jgi:hypothetical protein